MIATNTKQPDWKKTQFKWSSSRGSSINVYKKGEELFIH